MNQNSKLIVVFFFLSIVVLTFTFWFHQKPEFPKEQEEFPLKEKWFIEFDEKIINAILLDQGVFVRTEKKLYFFEANQLVPKWEFNITSDTSPGPIANVDDLIFVSNAKNLWALRKENGELVWKADVSHYLGKSENRIIAASKDSIVVNKTSVHVEVYNTKSGELRWRLPTNRGPIGGCYIAEKTVYLLDDGIYAYKEETGELLWESEYTNIIKGIFQDGNVYFVNEENELIGFDLSTKKQLWVFPLSSNNTPSFYLDNSTLYVSDDKFLWAISSVNADIKWSAGVSDGQNIVVIDSHVYLMENSQSRIQSYDKVTGDKEGFLTISRPNLFVFENDYRLSGDDELLFFVGKKIFLYK